MVAEDWWDSCAFFKHQKKWISVALKQVISYSYQKIIKNSWQQPSKRFFGPFTIFFSSKQFQIDAKLIFGFLLIHFGGATIDIWKKCPRIQFSGWATKRKKCEADLQHLKERLYDFLRHLRPSLAVFWMFRLHNCLLCVKMHSKMCD